MKKENRRIKMTKLLLRNTLLSMIHETPVERITVTALCEQADINRSTFYLHYQSVDDLLSTIENELYEAINAEACVTNCFEPDEDSLSNVFEVIYQNKELCQVLLGKNGNKEFLRRVMTIEGDRLMEEWSSSVPNVPRWQLEYVYHFCILGSIGLVEHWAEKKFQQSPQEIAALFSRIPASLIRGLSQEAE